MREPMKNLPKIVSEDKKEFQLRQPPESPVIFYSDGEKKDICKVYIKKSVLDKMIIHCMDNAKSQLEVMGFLVGEVFSWEGFLYSMIKDVVTTELISTEISVRFDTEGFESLFEKLDSLDYEYIIVGWYHSHPDLGCFLSQKDLETQKRMFNMSFHSAFVLDPVNEELKVFRLEEEGYQEIPFCILNEDDGHNDEINDISSLFSELRSITKNI
jgi:proteasome lid subunit RPN8/RPN11